MAITNRLRPLDLRAYIDANGDMLLSDAISAMQGGKGYVCPKCANKGIITLAAPVGFKTPCDVCAGYAKTDVQYISNGSGGYAAFLDITGPDTVAVGSTITLANTTEGGVWSSGNHDSATVNDATGVVTGVGAGVVTITYTVAGNAKTKDITVTEMAP